ncbi:hypothetical protein BaRGS_00014512, partial [Batillaria attramentaria]
NAEREKVHHYMKHATGENTPLQGIRHGKRYISTRNTPREKIHQYMEYATGEDRSVHGIRHGRKYIITGDTSREQIHQYMEYATGKDTSVHGIRHGRKYIITGNTPREKIHQYMEHATKKKKSVGGTCNEKGWMEHTLGKKIVHGRRHGKRYVSIWTTTSVHGTRHLYMENASTWKTPREKNKRSHR